MEPICPHCGAELSSASDAFCGECRGPLEEDPLTKPLPKPVIPVYPLAELPLESVASNGMSREEMVTELEQGGRFVVFQYCISPILVTIRNTSPIYFLRANEDGKAQAWKYNLLNVLFGWWGIPWGPIFTLAAVASNREGGKNVTTEVLDQLRQRRASFLT